MTCIRHTRGWECDSFNTLLHERPTFSSFSVCFFSLYIVIPLTRTHPFSASQSAPNLSLALINPLSLVFIITSLCFLRLFSLPDLSLSLFFLVYSLSTCVIVNCLSVLRSSAPQLSVLRCCSCPGSPPLPLDKCLRPDSFLFRRYVTDSDQGGSF